MSKWIIWLLTILIASLFAFTYIFFPSTPQDSLNVENIPTFTEVDVGFTHRLADGSPPHLGAAIIDVDGDGNYEIFVGGGEGQDDALLSYQEGKFVNIIEGLELSRKAATLGVISLDIDNDGDVDLIISRSNGLFMYMNEGKFVEKEIPLTLEEDSMGITVSPGDINNDGFMDLYVNTFVTPNKFKAATFNDPEHGKSNVMLVNKGDNTFSQKEIGLEIKQNTFLSAFIDLDGDGFQDLVAATNTDKVKIFRNNKDSTFSLVAEPTDYGFWMGMTLGDVDNDGDADIFFSNGGSFILNRYMRGDLRDDQVLDMRWTLLYNNGDFTFKPKFFENMGFGWGPVLEDLNLDGKLDLVIPENYIKYKPHHYRKYPGRLFIQDDDFKLATKKAGLENPYFGQSALTVDLNRDGYSDVVYVNVDGPLRVLLNDGGSQESIQVVLPDSTKSLGAKVTVNGITKFFIPGLGYMTDQSPEMIFPTEGPSKVTVEWLGGEIQVYENVEGRLIVS